jgi:hypothetical protein
MISIDYNKPIDRLDDVLFDVQLEKLFASTGSAKGENAEGKELPDYRLVCNKKTGKVISVVSKNYKLISNKEALEMGMELFHQLYPGVNTDELIPFRIVAPQSLASVHIDLIHKNVKFNMWEQETWLPFIRITNSYNRTYSLSFEVGFVKKLCSNGVLFNKKTMRLKYNHERNRRITLKTDAEKIISFSKYFEKQCSNLRQYELTPELMFPLICRILKISMKIPDERFIPNKIKNLEKLKYFTAEQTKSYEKNNGLNAYTAFNVATDLVSHNDTYNVLPGYYFNVRSFFTRPTDWMEDFSNKIIGTDFNLDEYLRPTIKGLNNFNEIAGFRWN